MHAADAFEGWQSCVRDSSLWACGEAAAEKLHALTVGREVACHKRNIDQYERTVAVCSNGEVDLGAELTRAGLALAYREFGTDYTDEEEEARDARRGAWAGEFTAPWAARRSRDGRLAPHADQPRDGPQSDCRGTGIKGNINGDGEQIYHSPGSANYDETVISRLGERWFCTEQEARRAGWRPPHN